MKKVTWAQAAVASNRVFCAVKPHCDKPGLNPLKDIYNNNLPGFMKEIVYQCAVYGTPVHVAMDMVTVYDACRSLDVDGWLE